MIYRRRSFDAQLRRSLPVSPRVVGIAITSTVALAACVFGGDSESFSSGRACRNVERLIEAVQAGDSSTAGEELDRLTDDDDVEEQIDAAELEDVVDDPDDVPDDDVAVAVEDAVSGLDCDLDIDDVDITDPATDPTVTEPTGTGPTAPTTEPTGTDSTTELTTTDPTTGATGATTFTLPPIPTTSTVASTVAPTTRPPATTAPGAGSTDAPSSDPSRTDPTSAPTDDPTGRLALITVDVDAIDSDDIGEHDPRRIEELARLFGLDGFMVPVGRKEIDLVYVAHDFGDAPSRYDDIGFRFASKLSEREVLARFRKAVSKQGQYSFERTDLGDDIAFDATPADLDDQIPNWEVQVSPKAGRVHRVEIVRSDYSNGVRTEMRDVIADERDVELALINDLGWEVTGFSYYSATDLTSSAYETSDLTFEAPGAIVDAKDRLVRALGRGAKARKQDDSFNIETPGGVWFLSDYGAGVSGRFSSR